MHSSKLSSALLATLTFLAAAPAYAASDVRVTIPAPTPQFVYEPIAYSVVVANIGNQSAAAVVLTVTLPATHTSPTKYVMGTLADVDTRCVQQGTQLKCTLGSIAKNQQKVITFDLALAQAAEVLPITAAATTTSSENSLANNSASNVPVLLHESISIPDGAQAHIRHCTGTGLTSFFECETSPSSISSHDHIFHADGTLTLVGAPAGYTGQWWQDAPDSLAFVYFEDGVPVAEFSGLGTNPDCFEGLTHFPGSAYVSPYEVCI